MAEFLAFWQTGKWPYFIILHSLHTKGYLEQRTKNGPRHKYDVTWYLYNVIVYIISKTDAIKINVLTRYRDSWHNQVSSESMCSSLRNIVILQAWAELWDTGSDNYLSQDTRPCHCHPGALGPTLPEKWLQNYSLLMKSMRDTINQPYVM